MTAIQEMHRSCELEAERMEMESRQKRLSSRLPELKGARQAADGALLEYESGHFRRFLDRLAGREEERQRALSLAARGAAAALDQAERELAAAEERLEVIRAEAQALRPRDVLMAELEPGEREHFRKLEASLSAEAALDILRENKKALEEALEWARPDLRLDAGHAKNRLMQEAAGLAKQCREKLARIAASGILLEVHPYFDNPAGYIACVAAEYGELDRINSALNAIRETESQLRELILQLTE